MMKFGKGVKPTMLPPPMQVIGAARSPQQPNKGTAKPKMVGKPPMPRMGTSMRGK
jgi:hypothetical protein